MRKLLLIILLPFTVFGQNKGNSENVDLKNKDQKASHPKREIYFSFGYNTEVYTKSNLKVDQSELGNDYTLEKVRGIEHKGWDDKLFTKPLTIPQYNYRLGYFFNDKHNLGVEINFDHTKFIIADGQTINIKGTLNNTTVDTNIVFSEANGFFYYLNNGANFLLFNLVKRKEFYADKSRNIKIDVLAKGGIGPVIPHVENSFFGNKNEPHFQIGGWNAGVETAVRVTFVKHIYLEYAVKLDYARYSNLKIYKGTVKHAFGTADMILNLGLTF